MYEYWVGCIFGGTAVLVGQLVYKWMCRQDNLCQSCMGQGSIMVNDGDDQDAICVVGLVNTSFSVAFYNTTI